MDSAITVLLVAFDCKELTCSVGWHIWKRRRDSMQTSSSLRFFLLEEPAACSNDKFELVKPLISSWVFGFK